MQIDLFGLLKFAKRLKMEKKNCRTDAASAQHCIFSGLRLVQYHTDRANIEIWTDKRVTLGKNERQNGKW